MTGSAGCAGSERAASVAGRWAPDLGARPLFGLDSARPPVRRYPPGRAERPSARAGRPAAGYTLSCRRRLPPASEKITVLYAAPPTTVNAGGLYGALEAVEPLCWTVDSVDEDLRDPGRTALGLGDLPDVKNDSRFTLT
jgi:hypothetical protein